MKIQMVCLGNICRSPLAHGLLRSKIDKLNLEIQVESAGTSGHHSGESPDTRMQQTAIKHGIDISDLRAEQFTEADFDRYDVIYAMDKSNYKNIVLLARNPKDIEKVKMILNESMPNQNKEVPDPYYGGQDGFQNVYNLLDEATDIIIKNIEQ